MPDKPQPIDYKSPAIQGIREILNKRPMQGRPWVRDPLDAIGNPDLPAVPHPPGFRPDPIIRGPQETAQAVHLLHRIAPEMRGRVSAYSSNPNRSILEDLDKAGIPPQLSDSVNVLGQYDFRDKDIWIRSPQGFGLMLGREGMLPTLAHEMGHSRGLLHGDKIKKLESDVAEAFPWGLKGR